MVLNHHFFPFLDPHEKLQKKTYRETVSFDIYGTIVRIIIDESKSQCDL